MANMSNEQTVTLAVKINRGLVNRLKIGLLTKRGGQSQQEFIVSVIKEAIENLEKEESLD
jgi:hypothetical protein